MSYISELRKIIGHRAIMATATAAIIYDEENKSILFEKRSDFGTWCIPGGAIELGESLEDALKREVKEETNIDIFNPVFFDVKASTHVIYPNQDEVYYTDITYIVTEFSGELAHDEESTELKWFKIDELPDNISPSMIDDIERFVNKYKEV